MLQVLPVNLRPEFRSLSCAKYASAGSIWALNLTRKCQTRSLRRISRRAFLNEPSSQFLHAARAFRQKAYMQFDRMKTFCGLCYFLVLPSSRPFRIHELYTKARKESLPDFLDLALRQYDRILGGWLRLERL